MNTTLDSLHKLSNVVDQVRVAVVFAALEDLFHNAINALRWNHNPIYIYMYQKCSR
jgi:hypothetical protein